MQHGSPIRTLAGGAEGLRVARYDAAPIAHICFLWDRKNTNGQEASMY